MNTNPTKKYIPFYWCNKKQAFIPVVTGGATLLLPKMKEVVLSVKYESITYCFLSNFIGIDNCEIVLNLNTGLHLKRNALMIGFNDSKYYKNWCYFKVIRFIPLLRPDESNIDQLKRYIKDNMKPLYNLINNTQHL